MRDGQYPHKHKIKATSAEKKNGSRETSIHRRQEQKERQAITAAPRQTYTHTHRNGFNETQRTCSRSRVLLPPRDIITCSCSCCQQRVSFSVYGTSSNDLHACHPLQLTSLQIQAAQLLFVFPGIHELRGVAPLPEYHHTNVSARPSHVAKAQDFACGPTSPVSRQLTSPERTKIRSF